MVAPTHSQSPMGGWRRCPFCGRNIKTVGKGNPITQYIFFNHNADGDLAGQRCPGSGQSAEGYDEVSLHRGAPREEYVVLGTSAFMDMSVAVGPFASASAINAAREDLEHKGYVVEICVLQQAGQIETVVNDEGV